MATLVGKWIRKGAKALSVLPGPLGLAGRAVNVITTIKDAKRAGAKPAEAFAIAQGADASIMGTQGNAGGSTNINFGEVAQADFLGIGKKKKEEEDKKKKQQYLMYGGIGAAVLVVLYFLTRRPSMVSKKW